MFSKEEYLKALSVVENYDDVDEMIKNREIIENLIKEHFEMLDKIKTGELSDGYHTFNELYYHRAVLFSIICNEHKDVAYKSKKHHDGTMYDGMFIVGINTPQGQYSYHYDLNVWSMFDVPELEFAPEWDGHKPSDIERLISINNSQPYKFEDLKIGMNKKELNLKDCEMCLNQFIEDTNYGRGDMVFNDHDEEIDTLRQLIKEHFELVEKYNRLYDECPQKCEMLKQLQDEVDKYKHEYFAMCDLFENPQPYKFEDLKEEMWVWDNKYDMWNHILEIRINCEKKQEIEFDYSLENDEEIYNDIYEENRFYPVQMANVRCE